MASPTDPSTRDLGTSRLKLADDLIFAPRVRGRNTSYHIEQPCRGKFYRVGYPEYIFLSLLDGSRTVSQALTLTARTLGSQALTRTRGTEVANWLLENRLAQFAESGSAWSPGNRDSSGGLGQALKRANPFWMKYSLGCPDRMLTAMLPALGWLFSTWATLAGLGVIGLGVGCILSNWPQFLASAANVMTPHNGFWLVLAWFFLKVIHELAHGLTCKFHRGEVREAGFIFMLLAPMAYVDVTSCWRFPSRWQRIHVAAAGMLAELFVAAVASLVWAHTDSVVLHQLLFNVIVMASLSTLLFNANPLMRFDGYYILADLVEIPNLSTDGNRFLKSAASRLFFGEKQRPLQTLGLRRWMIRAYGVAAAVWRLVICVSLAGAASVLLHGAGIVLAIAGLLGWFGMPLWKLCVDLQRRLHEKPPSFVRATAVGTALMFSLAAILLWVPWPGVMTAPGVVDYSDRSIVRSVASGFVERVHVADGEAVEAGQLLLELRNEALVAEQRELEVSLQQEQVLRRVALEQRNGANSQIAERNIQALQERLEEIRHQTDGLRVRAPLAGRVVARNLNQSVGQYLREGAEILTVADETSKELVISVGQQEIDSILPQIGQPTRFRIPGRWAHTGKLDRLDPRASTALPHPAMSSHVGGELAVIQQEAAGQSEMRLVEPRFRGVLTLSPNVSIELGAGEQGYVMLGLRQESIGQFLWFRLCRWCESLLRPTHV